MSRIALKITLAMLLFPAACAENDAGDREVTEAKRQHSEARAGSVADARSRHCFRNEYPQGSDESPADIAELIVDIEGAHVTGHYNWIPAYKDQRLGTFKGSLQGASIEAEYDYVQEGMSATVVISIRLGDDVAVIAGGPPELGLGATLARTECR